jgi:Uma2 family endonuclease
MSTLTVPPETKLVTGEELLAMGDIGPCELIDGRVIHMSPTGGEHGALELALGSELRAFVQPRKLGWIVSGEVGIYIRRNPDRIRAADVAFLSKQRLPRRPSPGFLEVAPELVVEVISPTDTWEDTRRKLADYFSIKVEWVWVVEPENRSVVIHRSLNEATTLNEGDVLKGEGVLEGFEMPIAGLFADE